MNTFLSKSHVSIIKKHSCDFIWFPLRDGSPLKRISWALYLHIVSTRGISTTQQWIVEGVKET